MLVLVVADVAPPPLFFGVIIDVEIDRLSAACVSVSPARSSTNHHCSRKVRGAPSDDFRFESTAGFQRGIHR